MSTVSGATVSTSFGATAVAPPGLKLPEPQGWPLDADKLRAGQLAYMDKIDWLSLQKTDVRAFARDFIAVQPIRLKFRGLSLLPELQFGVVRSNPSLTLLNFFAQEIANEPCKKTFHLQEYFEHMYLTLTKPIPREKKQWIRAHEAYEQYKTKPAEAILCVFQYQGKETLIPLSDLVNESVIKRLRQLSPITADEIVSLRTGFEKFSPPSPKVITGGTDTAGGSQTEPSGTATQVQSSSKPKSTTDAPSRSRCTSVTGQESTDSSSSKKHKQPTKPSGSLHSECEDQQQEEYDNFAPEPAPEISAADDTKKRRGRKRKQDSPPPTTSTDQGGGGAKRQSYKCSSPSSSNAGAALTGEGSSSGGGHKKGKNSGSFQMGIQIENVDPLVPSEIGNVVLHCMANLFNYPHAATPIILAGIAQMSRQIREMPCFATSNSRDSSKSQIGSSSLHQSSKTAQKEEQQGEADLDEESE